MRSVVASHVIHTVTLGQSGYSDAFTVTSNGSILPLTPGANAVYVPAGVNDARSSGAGHEPLVIGAPHQVTSTIDGFGSEDVIDLQALTATSFPTAMAL